MILADALDRVSPDQADVATLYKHLHFAGVKLVTLAEVECGCCDRKFGIVVNDRYGCLNRFRRGTCDNSRTIRRGDIERRALSGLAEKLVSAQAVRDAVGAYVEQANVENRERRIQVELDRRALDKVQRSIAGIMAAIEDGMYQPAMRTRMAELEQQKAELAARGRSAIR